MADIDIDPFGEHESRPEEPTDETFLSLQLEEDQHGNQRMTKKHHLESQRTKLMKDYVKDLYKRISENDGEPQKNFTMIISNSKMESCTTEVRESP